MDDVGEFLRLVMVQHVPHFREEMQRAAGNVLMEPDRVERRLDNLVRLARRSVAANRARALAVIAIVAIAEFLVVALSAFELGPPPAPADVRSPTGGWTTIASFGTRMQPFDTACPISSGLDVPWNATTGIPPSKRSSTSLYALVGRMWGP